MAGKFSLFPVRGGKFGFRLVASNGEIVLSSQGYASKAGAKAGVASVQRNCGQDARFERKQAKNGKGYFVLKAANGLVIGKSEMYNSARALENGIRAVKSSGKSRRVDDEKV
jgi:uncharacterized protein